MRFIVPGALQGTGREVRVLTSTYGVPQTSAGIIWRRDDEGTGVSIHRWLHEYYLDHLIKKHERGQLNRAAEIGTGDCGNDCRSISSL